MGCKPESDATAKTAEIGPDSGERPLRADARRNRDRLVETAAAAFVARGVDVPLEDIAREAGVGIGTLYRHFPTREHLVAMVYRREVQALCAAAADLATALPPDAALEAWMHRFVDYMATKRGLAKSLAVIKTSDSTLFTDVSGQMSAALNRLVEAAAAAGSIRPDARGTDLIHALTSIYSLPDGPDWRQQADRLVDLFMGGLRWGARS